MENIFKNFNEFTESLNEKNDDINPSDKYAMVMYGGSIGKSGISLGVKGKMTIVYHTSNDLDFLKEKTKRWNKMLSPGEKKYYRMRYSVVTLTPKQQQEISDQL